MTEQDTTEIRPALQRFMDAFAEKANMTLDENNQLVDPVAALMFEAYCYGRRVQETGKRIYIVGGVSDKGIEFSVDPYIHETHEDARQESVRLRKRHRKQFFVFSTSKALLGFLKEEPDFTKKNRKKEIHQGKPTVVPDPSAQKPLSRREQKYAEFNALQTKRKQVTERLMDEIHRNNRANGTFASAGIVVENNGIVLFGKKPEHLEEWYQYFSRAFGGDAMTVLMSHGTEAVQIQEFYLNPEKKVYVDGYQIADGYSICVWNDAMAHWEEILMVKDNWVHHFPGATGIGPVPFTEELKAGYIAMKRINHTHLASMSNRFFKTTFDLMLPIEDPNYKEKTDSLSQCEIDAL